MATRQQQATVNPRVAPEKPHLVIISHDVVDHKMAGPGIRYWELARVLAQHVSVTLAVPGGTRLTSDGFDIHAYSPSEWESLRPVIEGADILMPCGYTLAGFPAITDAEKPLVIDGYDPLTAEVLAFSSTEPVEQQERRYQDAWALLCQECQRGDFFLCASERQRDWWLGLLEARGRINPRTYRDDPSLRQLIDVLPFGCPPDPPQHTRQVLKGVVPGIGRDDKVILWGGGIWEWLDPLTLIRATAEIKDRAPNIRTVLPGTRHPNTEVVPEMPMRERAMRLSDELGLTGRYVFFGDWVAYADWPNYLLEADVGVSLHFDTLETRLAYRSRILDYVWAGLPMVVTGGDAMSELVQQHELGVLVDYQDVKGVGAALLRLLDIEPAVWRQRFTEPRARFAWDNVAKPLIAFCTNPRRAADWQGTGTTALPTPRELGELRGLLRRREAELERANNLVAAYEAGRFMRLMRTIASFRARVTG
jgi:glycosyltransferase involved in cell wall biosynthesis